MSNAATQSQSLSGDSPIGLPGKAERHVEDVLGSRYGAERLAKAKRAADWLVRSQRPSGKWLYRFNWSVRFDPDADGKNVKFEKLRAGWASALAQGQGMSLLGRIYRTTGETRYLRAIRRAVRTLRTRVTEGGLSRRTAEGIYFEEYPTQHPYYVMNGNVQTLIGLWDVEDIAPSARPLFRRGSLAMQRAMHRFDGGEFSVYALGWRTPTNPSYSEGIPVMLRVLERISGRKAFGTWAERWTP